MRIRMKMQVSGTRGGTDNIREWPYPGEELDVPDEEGAGLCASGIAEPVAVRSAGKAPVERAVVPSSAEPPVSVRVAAAEEDVDPPAAPTGPPEHPARPEHPAHPAHPTHPTHPDRPAASRAPRSKP